MHIHTFARSGTHTMTDYQLKEAPHPSEKNNNNNNKASENTLLPLCNSLRSNIRVQSHGRRISFVLCFPAFDFGQFNIHDRCHPVGRFPVCSLISSSLFKTEVTWPTSSVRRWSLSYIDDMSHLESGVWLSGGSSYRKPSFNFCDCCWITAIQKWLANTCCCSGLCNSSN